MSIRPYFEAAVKNVYKHGDTDIFPFPIENRIFHDEIASVCDLLCEAYDNFDDRFAESSPEDIRSQVPIHHTGFRWATQLDPFWNAFYLGSVLSIAERIEARRLSSDTVFSYRLDPTSLLAGNLFRMDLSWIDFVNSSRKAAEKHDYVVICDISDCYARISHHKLENALRLSECPPHTSHVILRYLAYLTGTKSSGLPIGGPASRILAELALINVDQIMADSGIVFYRYADDYHLFCNSRREAYEALVRISEALDNDGLALQRSKTRILRNSEYLAASKSLINEDTDTSAPIHRLMSLSLRYDPYSANSQQNYETLREQLSSIDIVSLLNEQLSRSRVHIPATKKIIAAIRTLEADAQYGAIISMLNSMDILYPISSNVFILIKSVFSNMSHAQRDDICERIRQLYDEGHEVMTTPIAIAFAVRILGDHPIPANQTFLNRCFDKQTDPLVRRDIIMIFSNWGYFAWLSIFKSKFVSVSGWERRALILASFSMVDEGSHWRKHVKNRFSPTELIVRDWRSTRTQQSPQLPL
ncbi:RNA-directed DNA polymerase [Aurantimonas coralicida]|uniref:RNA-directed DNA polymerase n=1 Tax=Aurantimonas coralicida TaxID=182270 RepID=UPI001E607FE0|nr:RNA-directed DNA polymerase [Aurantimonas coralicida]MCD1641349.1 RNA-directed DNA polymerase [Aurantimonas coralicida]